MPIPPYRRKIPFKESHYLDHDSRIMKGRKMMMKSIGKNLNAGIGVISAVLFLLFLFANPIVNAQSPAPTSWMEDSRPSVGYYYGANAGIVEGLGSLGCSGAYYSQSQIENQTVSWINANRQTITEISPQLGCGSISQYESLISNISSYVESHSSNPSRYWGGIMLDEEPGFSFTASQLETLNNYVYSVMASTPGVSFYFTENQPNGWPLSTYNSIIGGSYPAPQVYSQGANSMAAAVNTDCSQYGYCTNLVTIDTANSYPMNNPSYITGSSGLITGTPWTTTAWGNGYWYNLWRAQ